MLNIKVIFSSIILIFILLGCTVDAPIDTGVGSTGDESSSAMVTRNNEIRAERFSGSPISWSDTLAISAQEHADYLASTNTFEHGNSPYGENLYASGSDVGYVTAINSWYEEKSYFNTTTKEYSYQSGHYTQLIWKNTTEVGCAKSSSSSWRTIIVCRYNPPGNYIGQSAY